jgi:hypothetical protein
MWLLLRWRGGGARACRRGTRDKARGVARREAEEYLVVIHQRRWRRHDSCCRRVGRRGFDLGGAIRCYYLVRFNQLESRGLSLWDRSGSGSKAQ